MFFYDDPKVEYENPPPPSEDFEYNFEPIFFTYPRPQCVQGVNFITIDRSLIHRSLLGYEEKEEEQTTIREEENNKGAENTEGKKVESSSKILVNRGIEDGIGKGKVTKENSEKSGNLDKTKIRSTISPEDESATFSLKKKKEGKQKNKSKGEKANIDSDDLKKNQKQKALVSKSSALQSISKSYSTSESDSDNSDNHKTKSSHHGKSHSKKSSRHRKKDKDSRSDVSNSDKIRCDKVGLRSTETFVKKEIVSSDEESISSSFSKKAEIAVKEEVLSDKDDYEKDKGKSSKSSKKKYDDSRSQDDFRSRKENRDLVDSRRRGRSREDSSSRDDDSKKNYSDYSSDDDSRSRRYEDSNNSSKSLNPCIKREMKQEIKQEPGSANCYALNDFYCDVCKLNLNSETTFSSHMAGKRHKKAVRQLSEQEVAKSSVMEITESQNFPRPPDMDRIELYDEASRIQETCEDRRLFILGLDYVHEIRGYEETKYYCDLCAAQCVANSIIKHLIGHKHQMSCLRKYCPRSYDWVQDLEKKDRRAERELKFQLEEAKRSHGRGRIRVFKDVKRNQTHSAVSSHRICQSNLQGSPEPFYPYQPGPSRQDSPDVPNTTNVTDLKITDEDCLSRNFSDFYCRVCDSHMNNYSMWESHARGKRHLKNKKKAPEGLVTNSNFIEAPRGTISHLEDMIYDECGPNDIIVGLNFIRENQGENGDLYNCYLCGSVCPSIDILDHIFLKKHKTKYLEKMLADGHQNAVNEISMMPIGESAREGLIDDECEKLMLLLGRGKPVIGVTKKTF